VAVRYYGLTADLDCKVEYRKAIASVIPSLIKWLERGCHPCVLTQLIGELANHGEW
jgi:hypothetical protein